MRQRDQLAVGALVPVHQPQAQVVARWLDRPTDRAEGFDGFVEGVVAHGAVGRASRIAVRTMPRLNFSGRSGSATAFRAGS